MHYLRKTLLPVAAVGALAAIPTTPAGAHISVCHLRHSCPSDHATYRWHGMRCVKPSADERNTSFTIRVRYGGRTYYCKR
jgi:hypothetical protein